MITYSWRTGFDTGEEREVGEMLAAAAEADADAGFPAVSLGQPYPDDARHPVVRLLPDGRPGHEGSSPVAAYLRVEPEPDGGPATVRYVVRPEFRSRGISTLLVEKIGAGPGGLGRLGGYRCLGTADLGPWGSPGCPAHGPAVRMRRGTNGSAGVAAARAAAGL